VEILTAIEVVAEGLGELKDRCFLTGGVSIPFYITDPLEEPPRVTLDVDVAIEVHSAQEYREVIESRLRDQGFKHDISEGAPICRWIWHGIIVDIMPVEASVLGFSNPWYQAGLNHTIPISVSARCQWRILSAPFALAAKAAAFWSRGAEDPSNSHDLEDLVTLINGRPEIIEEVGRASAECREYITAFCKALLEEARFREVLSHHLPFGDVGQQRLPVVLERLERIAAWGRAA
jgi:hypothetical protein